MMTSNRPLEDWAKLIGDVLAATAILAASCSMPKINSVTGKSHRVRNRSKTKERGRPSADGERYSTPEDTEPVTALSSDGKQQAPTA